ncbi:periplasmic heavy metal sensor [Pukyongiella litopenaei]|uniref:Periplasmic heavy metal sensor n=1 Tax=Pukyongiella litopenaei TaxID=2605946 RepID=A0A2S0MMB1_9RHOB|nr:periplasmic heavy metal sensor [Pukyongiella litopenaei]AVO37020.1 periplasmic heavy metal sensor [Pukyongiella litopenaei]
MSDYDDMERRRWPWLKIALGVSLALNLVVAGVVIGAVARPGGHDPHRGEPVGAALFRDLPREDRRAMWRAMNGTKRPDGQAERREIAALLRATPFDAAALGDYLDRRQISHAERQRVVREKWLERVVAMSDDERAAFAARLEKPRKTRKGDRDRQHHDRRPD